MPRLHWFHQFFLCSYPYADHYDYNYDYNNYYFYYHYPYHHDNYSYDDNRGTSSTSR